MKKSSEILQTYWHHSKFRPMQEEIIDHIIYGHDCLAILPTGGGKSICFQIPGLAREGLTIVISPLIALMQDQVKNLKDKGIKASFINSSMSYRDIDITLDNAKFGGTQFLYTSPERVNTELFKKRLEQMNVSLFVIDEAHCISEWGHDFRPSYKLLTTLREIHPDVPIAAFTASATKEVQKDIINSLKLKEPNVFESSAQRKNLSYRIIETEDKFGQILHTCRTYKESVGIIYCQTRRSVKEIVLNLRKQGFYAEMYHGGMDSKQRKLTLERWLKDEVKIIVATNAFGMGIDKPDVRFVIHFELPNSIENYYQESGRAGRDNNFSTAIGYFNDGDLERLHQQLIQKYPSIELIRRVYNALCNYLSIAVGSGKGENYEIELIDFSKKFNIKIPEVYYSLKAMQLLELIHFNEVDFSPTRLQFDVEKKTLYNFQITHEKSSKLITLLSRHYPGIFDRFISIDETEIAKILNYSESQLLSELKFLEQYGVILINYKSKYPTIEMLENRLANTDSLVHGERYNKRKNVEQKRLAEMLNYLETQNCRQVFISNYFGVECDPCGICDNCEKTQSEDNLAEKIKLLLPSSFNEIEARLKVNRDKLKLQIQELLLQEAIIFQDEKYQIKI